jgi:2-iminobutanoate/2-iminopropanoate deaminase
MDSWAFMLSHMTIFDNPSGVPAPPAGRYSHVARVDLGGKTLLLLSGQIATDENGSLVGTGDMTAQADYIFDQVGKILAAHGATFGDVVNVRTYLTDMDRIAEFGAARRPRFNPDAMPTSTTVEVSRLFVDGALLEIEVTAVVLRVDWCVRCGWRVAGCGWWRRSARRAAVVRSPGGGGPLGTVPRRPAPGALSPLSRPLHQYS